MANAESRRPLIAIVGPTGTGKSELSLDLAERIVAAGGSAEIVNADAMQLYRGMDIGTAKLPVGERRGIRHHLLDVLDVTDDASVAWYQPLARAAIDDIAERGGVPILVGGSGLYVSSVIYDFSFPARDPVVRASLERELAALGAGALHERLRAAAPATAARIDPANGRRLVRALEVLELAGTGHGGALPEEPISWRPMRVLALDTPREPLTARLDARVERMWREGIVEEAAALIPRGIDEGTTARRAIGYAQALAQLRGESTESEAVVATQQLTRRYARRQRSWFARYREAARLDTEAGDIVSRAAAAIASID